QGYPVADFFRERSLGVQAAHPDIDHVDYRRGSFLRRARVLTRMLLAWLSSFSMPGPTRRGAPSSSTGFGVRSPTSFGSATSRSSATKSPADRTIRFIS